MKKTLVLAVCLCCTLLTYGQYGEFRPYLKSDLIAKTGLTYPDIKLYGFKDQQHAETVLHAISYKGKQKKDYANCFFITDLNELVIQATKSFIVFKDDYVVHYKPHFDGTAIILEFYKLNYKTGSLDPKQPVRLPEMDIKQMHSFIEEIKQLADLYKNDSELQKVLTEETNRINDKNAEYDKRVTNNLKNIGLGRIYPGFNKEEVAYRALNESVNDFNAAVAAKPDDAFSSLVNWKKIKGIEFFNDSKFISKYGGRLVACRIGDKGAQSGFIIYHANYDTVSKNLAINCIEMLKTPGVLKRNYESSLFRAFTNIDQLEVTSDEVYHKHAASILADLVTNLDKYKNNPEFANYFQAKQAQEENSKKQADLRTKEVTQKAEVNKTINKGVFEIANKEILKLQEGDVLCLINPNDDVNALDAGSKIIAYVEKYNTSKTKLQIRIHSVSEHVILNVYEKISFVKGDMIWINLPMTDKGKYWITCK